MRVEDHMSMALGRALMTETERKYLTGEYGDQRRYEAVSRVRSRIQGPLSKDMEWFDEHAPQLAEELEEVVCDNDDS